MVGFPVGGQLALGDPRSGQGLVLDRNYLAVSLGRVSRVLNPDVPHPVFILRVTAQAMGEKYGVEFLYRDFRPLFQTGQEFAREHGFYMQKYCGCIFSEEDRYMAAKRKKKARQAAAQTTAQ